MAIQSDGKIVVGGAKQVGFVTVFAVARYNADLPVGINSTEENKNEITIYPNPLTEQTTITFSDNEYHNIQIRDILGKEIKTISFTGRQLILDKGEMKTGIYFVQTMDQQKHICNRKIIIQ